MFKKFTIQIVLLKCKAWKKALDNQIFTIQIVLLKFQSYSSMILKYEKFTIQIVLLK
ncbi:hypothetical protein JMUB4039_1023 [Leptotrichia trevisanii]|nr:hypothetical protein JMUB4039_1023 [Leptotrichia trevisanii]